LFRLTLTIPLATYAAVTLKTRYCGKVYLNGVQIADAGSFGATDKSWPVPLGRLLPGQKNVIAWQGPQVNTSTWRFTNLELDLA
jgi:hypothetical protein